jgi:hypothetical protein
VEPSQLFHIVWGIAVAAGGFVIKRAYHEIDRSREKISELFRLNANLERQLAEAKLETAKEYVTHDGLSEFKTEFFKRVDTIESKLDRFLERQQTVSDRHARP